jgi:hypothetical protein
MPGDPRECRQHALHCLELARKASSPEAKAKFLDLASHWSQIATSLESALPLLETEKEKSC